MVDVPPARHLLRAKDLVDARYYEPLLVTNLAAAAGLSPAYFSREVPRCMTMGYGRPPNRTFREVGSAPSL